MTVRTVHALWSGSYELEVTAALTAPEGERGEEEGEREREGERGREEEDEKG